MLSLLCDTCCLTRGSFQFCFVAPCKECKNFERNKFQTVESCYFPPKTEWFQTFDSFFTFAFTVSTIWGTFQVSVGTFLETNLPALKD